MTSLRLTGVTNGFALLPLRATEWLVERARGASRYSKSIPYLTRTSPPAGVGNFMAKKASAMQSTA